MMRHGVGVGIKNYNVADTLRKIKWDADYFIFGLVALADDLNHGFRNDRKFARQRAFKEEAKGAPGTLQKIAISGRF